MTTSSTLKKAVRRNRTLESLVGRDTAPRDTKGFIAWARDLPHPVIHEMLLQAESVSVLKTYKIPFGVWKRFDQMPGFPDGLLPMGEALTSFNPMYGQGMSLAAGQALCYEMP